MYTPKQPEAHSSQSQWLTWQSAWQPLCTLETPLRLYSRPVLPCSLPSPPYPLPSWRPPLPTSHYPTLHLTCQSTFGTPGPSLPYLPTSLTMMPIVLETNSAPWNWHTVRYRKYCPLTLNFINKNDRRGESSLCERSPFGLIQKGEKEEQCRVQTHIQQYCVRTAVHTNTLSIIHFHYRIHNNDKAGAK